jgi:hypothetical protein
MSTFTVRGRQIRHRSAWVVAGALAVLTPLPWLAGAGLIGLAMIANTFWLPLLTVAGCVLLLTVATHRTRHPAVAAAWAVTLWFVMAAIAFLVLLAVAFLFPWQDGSGGIISIGAALVFAAAPIVVSGVIAGVCYEAGRSLIGRAP